MSDPLVVAICLVNGRPEMVKRAVASFRAQTYARKILVVYDTGTPSISWDDLGFPTENMLPVRADWRDRSIGALRNEAISTVYAAGDIIMHWDSDDWSHPQRMAEQVALLQSSGADIVGYDQMLFWDSRDRGESWLYTYTARPWQYCIGTSMCYWRSVWEKQPFHDGPRFGPGGEHIDIAEDLKFQQMLNRRSITSITVTDHGNDQVPRIIASVHGANTLSKIQPALTEWQRVTNWDAYCREIMKL